MIRGAFTGTRTLAVGLIVAGAFAHARPAPVLTLRVTGPGSVQATPRGTLLGCSANSCLWRYRAGTVVKLSAAPAGSGASLARWGSACGRARPTCSIRMTTSRTVTATFSPVRLYGADLGRVAVRPPGKPCGTYCLAFPYRTRVTLTPRLAPGDQFVRWYDPCAAAGRTPSCALRLTQDTQSPGFDMIQVPRPCRLPGDYPRSGPVADCPWPTAIEQVVPVAIRISGRGSVAIGSSRCSRSCVYRLKLGSMVALQAVTTHSRFTGWQGRCRGRGPVCQLSAIEDLRGNAPSATAVFR